MKSVLHTLVLAAAVAGCSDIPKDTEGSLDRIRGAKAFRVGLIAGSKDVEDRGRRLIQAVAADSGATPQLTTGAAEHLITQLEGSELDLVIGAMAKKSPWALKVHASNPLSPATEKDALRVWTKSVAMARGMPLIACPGPVRPDGEAG